MSSGGGERERLEVLVGRWRTEGWTRMSGDLAAETIDAMDTYEWLPGEFALLHVVDARVGDRKVEGVEIIGYDPARASYVTLYFGSDGTTAYEATLVNEEGALEWAMRSEATRFAGRFSTDGNTITGHWERLDDGSPWRPWMDITLTKQVESRLTRRSSMRIRIVTVYVTDQDAARAFYTEKLGFVLRDDAPYGPDFRWLTVESPENDATELYLAHEDRYPGAKAYREAMYAGGVPVVGLSTENICGLHRSLTANGVTFTSEPAEAEFGGINAVIDDGCGNLLNLHQDAQVDSIGRVWAPNPPWLKGRRNIS